MIYLDSSAVLKLVFEEAESSALAAWLGPAAGPAVASDLVRIEVSRACRRLDPGSLPAAAGVLAGIDTLRIGAGIVARACEIGGDHLRSLDAIHLATAAQLGPGLATFVTYDRRLAEAARAAGLPVMAPGARE